MNFDQFYRNKNEYKSDFKCRNALTKTMGSLLRGLIRKTAYHWPDTMSIQYTEKENRVHVWKKVNLGFCRHRQRWPASQILQICSSLTHSRVIWQTVQTKIKRSSLRRLILVCTVCITYRNFYKT